MTDQWQELKETITEMRDNDGTGTQQEVCKFLANYMDILEKQMQEPCGDVVSKQAVLDIVDSYSESQSNVEDVTQDIISDIVALPPVNPQPCEELDFVQPHKKFPVNLEACKMREATQEEREGIEQYIDSISIAESCEDAISREDALMCLTGEIKETDTIETIIARFVRRIRNLPSVKPQEPKTGYWIPVSERLPERSGEYLVSVIDGSGEDNDYKAVRVVWFAHKKNYRITESEWRELGIDETVIAWMPLPAPYKTEREE